MFDYSLLNNFAIYQPSIEVSRGCGNGCSFCLEKDYKPCALKSPNQIFKEIRAIENTYGTQHLNVYFESSIFLPTEKWANEFLSLYISTNSQFKWRCTTRVDIIKPETIIPLAKAGLKVIDFGLESASTSQLVAMNKTKNPEKYLEKADIIIKLCYKNGVWCKLNVMLYAGETFNTFDETAKWLLKRKKYIKGISANPLTIYLNGETDNYCKELEQITKTQINLKELHDTGITFPDLSLQIRADTAKNLCKKLSSMIMTEQDYLDLKEICYSARNI